MGNQTNPVTKKIQLPQPHTILNAPLLNLQNENKDERMNRKSQTSGNLAERMMLVILKELLRMKTLTYTKTGLSGRDKIWLDRNCLRKRAESSSKKLKKFKKEAESVNQEY